MASLADELRALGAGYDDQHPLYLLGQRAAAALEEKDEALRKILAEVDFKRLLWDDSKPSEPPYGIDLVRAALRAGEGS